jgi:hypothetical protein
MLPILVSIGANIAAAGILAATSKVPVAISEVGEPAT